MNDNSNPLETIRKIIRTIVWDTDNSLPLGTAEMLKNWIWLHRLCKNDEEINWEIENMFKIGLGTFEIKFIHSESGTVYNFFNFARGIGAITEDDITDRMKKFMEDNPRYHALWKITGDET